MPKLRSVVVAMIFGAFIFPFLSMNLLAQSKDSRPEEIEWTWEVRPVHSDPKLPNVLLVGDSITRNYYPEVKRILADVANVYLFAASTSLGDPRLNRQLKDFAALEGVQFSVVHFNNGMHGWEYSEPEYEGAFPSYLSTLHAIAPSAIFIWATTTPVKKDNSPGATNLRVEARNELAQKIMVAASIPIDDQHELMTHHSDLYEDNVHFNSSGAAVQGQQTARLIRKSLQKEGTGAK